MSKIYNPHLQYIITIILSKLKWSYFDSTPEVRDWGSFQEDWLFLGFQDKVSVSCFSRLGQCSVSTYRFGQITTESTGFPPFLISLLSFLKKPKFYFPLLSIKKTDKTKLKLSGEVLYPGISSRSLLLTGRGEFIEVLPANPSTIQELGRVKTKTDLKLNFFLLVFMQSPKQKEWFCFQTSRNLLVLNLYTGFHTCVE